MRVVNQITFEAKDDAEALRLAGERLGKDAVILSTRTVRVGGFLGLFQHHVLMVSAGILEEDAKEERPKEKDDTAKERLVAFQKLLEFKQAAETRGGSGPSLPAGGAASWSAPPSNEAAKVIYSPPAVKKEFQDLDSVTLSSEGLMNASRSVSRPETETGGVPVQEVSKLREEVGDLTKRLEMVLRRLEDGPGAVAPEPRGEKRVFEAGLPGVTPQAVDFETDALFRKLLASDLDPRYARQWTREYSAEATGVSFSDWLGSKIRCADSNSSAAMGGRKVMLLGPTGVGKTTTIAKLAAIQALWEHRNVLLLTSDTYRIAAVDQLRTYAKILGVPIEVIFEAENFEEVLKGHADAELVLLDTAGRGQRDRKNLEAFKVLYDAFQPDAVHLVLAANMKYRDMLDVVERMSVVPVTHVIFTKMDETVSYGALCNILEILGRPVSFFTTGQNVPNDIEVALGARLAGLLMGDPIRGSTRA